MIAVPSIMVGFGLLLVPPAFGCTPTTTVLQFDGGYEVSMCYRTPDGDEGQAKSGIWASGQAGLLWFFDRGNAEVLVKVLDGCSHNGHRWAFVAPVTTLEFNLWVTGPDGRRWTHSNRQGAAASTKADTRAFSCSDESGGGGSENGGDGSASAPDLAAQSSIGDRSLMAGESFTLWASALSQSDGRSASTTLRAETRNTSMEIPRSVATPAAESPDVLEPTASCTPTTTALTFDGGYELSMCYRTPDGDEGQAESGIWASGQAGLLWFFDRGNAEVLVKVLDGCSHNGHRWAFVAPVTTLEFNLWVTGPDGRRWTHSNRQGAAASTKADTRAFSCSDESGGDGDRWVFAGDIPPTDQLALRNELVQSRGYFLERFGLVATDFTILVGENYAALAPVYEETVGSDLSTQYPPHAIESSAWVTSSVAGHPVVTLIYGKEHWEPDRLGPLVAYIVHEYFHVLQWQQRRNWSDVPHWIVEGHASYADYLYSSNRPDRRPFLGDRYTPMKDLAVAHTEGRLDFSLLRGSESYSGCSFGFHEYALSFVAARFLADQTGEDSYIEFWRLLGRQGTWQQAFEEAFGTDVSSFLDSFKPWLLAQLPSYAQVRLSIVWPGLLPRGESLSFDMEDASWETGESPYWRTSTRLGLQSAEYIYSYSAGNDRSGRSHIHLVVGRRMAH